MANEPINLSVSAFVALTNQILDTAFPTVVIEGEVASFKVNQGKFVFFDLKDSEATVGCFMTLWQLKTPIEDGMRVQVVATPKLTNWGKFSLTVQTVKPVGEGSLKRSFEMLKAKLAAEGLFDSDRKRPLPDMPKRIAVISSVQAAGYADFIKILQDRWGGLEVEVASVQVQGSVAAGQIIRAIQYFNEQPRPAEALVIVRGGGSADDLAVFNDEELVRAVAASRIPTLTGIGHEVDTSLVDLASDVRAATPSNAAQLLVPDRQEMIAATRQLVRTAAVSAIKAIDIIEQQIVRKMSSAAARIELNVDTLLEENKRYQSLVRAYNPTAILERGYAIIRGQPEIGKQLDIETNKLVIRTEVQHVTKK
ncbi:MAG TPA: exodeoxyribonuclease VII large subunit [Candidatus Saccharibacteria bacterium]|nr:exodeoxyribonuclease VII large subunit [Candidatus Saccharibacteria bacterium]HMR38745.1 exodeoxyribonuclease VII large subunit [Candidatus Saccharibacteria bacterium]